jgi:hypothetical protein
MKSSVIHLSPLGQHNEHEWTVIEWLVAEDGGERIRLRHGVRDCDQHLLTDPGRGDHALVSILFRAMERGKDIIVEGEVSPKLLEGLETLQSIWQRWKPQRYRTVAIRAEEESELTPIVPNRPALCAFSGGVDGAFSFFRHYLGLAGRNTCRPGAAMLVHGMDIPLERKDFFLGAAQRAERMLSGTGVPLLLVCSSTRNLKMDWENSFGLQLFSCFLLFQKHFAWAINGSGEPYETLVLPWGSTPVTDPLCATAAMQLIIDGCSFDRTEKVRWLVNNTKITQELRVCWAGKQLDRNCGVCEKCIRTMLNFWALGADIPEVFPSKLNQILVKSLRPKNEIQLRELLAIKKHAEKFHHKNDPILESLKNIIFKYKIKKFFLLCKKNLMRLSTKIKL